MPIYLGVLPFELIRTSGPYWDAAITSIKHRASSLCGRRVFAFGPAAARNIFLVAKPWYVIQVIHFADANIQILHHVFATFVWGSTWGLMRRYKIFLRVQAGGLGLTHIFARQLVSWLDFFRTASYPFLVTFFHTQFLNSLTDIIVSKAVGGSRRGWEFVKEIVDALHFLWARFSAEYLFTVPEQNLYCDFIDLLFPTPFYRNIFC